MHRFMKLKAALDPNRSSTKGSEGINNQPSVNSLPVLELSLPDSKSFRASVILPDLSRRFTLLRTNGELLPIDNFRERLRYQLQTGHITHEDENILMNQYRHQYLTESSSPAPLNYSATIPPTEDPPSFSCSPKKSSTAINVLFSANTSARDAAYIRKTLKMSKDPSTNKSKPQSELTLSKQPLVTVGSPEDKTPKTFSIPLDPHIPILSTQAINPDQSDCMDEWDGEDEVELGPTQMQRLSYAVDRILDSHLHQKPRAVESQPESVVQHSTVSSPLDAEFRVHEELFRALPTNSSLSSPPKASIAPATSQPKSFQEYPNAEDHAQLDSSQQLRSRTLSIDSATSSDETMNSQLYQDSLELLFPDEDGFDDNTSVFDFAPELDDLPNPSPFFDREQSLPFIDFTYDDVVFIQQSLLSFPSQQQPQRLVRSKTKNPAPRVDMPSPTPSHNQTSPLSSRSLQRNPSTTPSLSSLADPHSSLSSQDPMPPLLSPRSSALQQRLNLAKATGIGACQKMRTLRQHPDDIHSPTEFSPNGLHSPFPQLISPSVTDSPDISTFPLTPPTHFVRSPAFGQSYIPSPPTSADLAASEKKEARPRNFNSRSGRPLPTTILFRDVEAQAVAANVALRKTSHHHLDAKRFPTRKKMISTAQIGAPKLLSASAEITGIELERTETDFSRQSSTQRSKGISKGTFKLRLKKKRPSESAASQCDTQYSADEPPKPMKSFGSIPNLREETWTGSSHAREPTNDLATHLGRPNSRDQLALPTSRKHGHALTSFRKLMDRHRKSTSNLPQSGKFEDVPSSPSISFSTSSDLVPSEKAASPSRPRRPRANTKDTECELDQQAGWPSQRGPTTHQQFHRGPAPPGFALGVESEISHTLGEPFAEISTASTSSFDVYPSEQSPEVDRWDPSLVHVTGPIEEDGEPIEYESPVSPTRAYEQDTNRGSSKWLSVQGADPYESRSDYASSILDLYGCDSHSPRPISNRSSVSRYSTNFEPSRPASPTSTPGLSQPIEPTTSATSTTGSDRLSSPRPPHNPDEDELMGLVHQLQSSTRFSKFDPNPSSLNLNDHHNSPESFLNQNLPNHPLLVNKFDLDVNAQVDEEEAQVWKQILDC
ncbi:hypothetical protein MJO29_007197 [Puccinia striiformis f. sp. tritici]|nr:hypothetical protein MJO29_007197 [Puccinia striiformis f. sp. tritici]